MVTKGVSVAYKRDDVGSQRQPGAVCVQAVRKRCWWKILFSSLLHAYQRILVLLAFVSVSFELHTSLVLLLVLLAFVSVSCELHTSLSTFTCPTGIRVSILWTSHVTQYFYLSYWHFCQYLVNFMHHSVLLGVRWHLCQYLVNFARHSVLLLVLLAFISVSCELHTSLSTLLVLLTFVSVSCELHTSLSTLSCPTGLRVSILWTSHVTQYFTCPTGIRVSI